MASRVNSPFGLRPSWAIDSGPIWAQGIIVNNFVKCCYNAHCMFWFKQSIKGVIIIILFENAKIWVGQTTLNKEKGDETCFMECWVCSIIIECVNFLNNRKTSLVVLMQRRTAAVRKREIPQIFRWFEYPPNIPTQIKTPTVKCKHCTAYEQVPLLGYYRILYWGLLASLNAILEVSYEILLH